MKTRKHKFPVFTPRLTVFLLFLSMLLSVLTVFPSSVVAVGSEGEPIADNQEVPLNNEDVSLQEPMDTSIETEFENLDGNTISTTTLISQSAIHNTDNTTIMLSGDTTDIAQGSTRDLRVNTTLEDAVSVSFEVSNSDLLSLGTPGPFQLGEVHVTLTANVSEIAAASVTVTATVHCSSGVTETVSLEVYIPITDGIYEIASCANHLPTSLGSYYLRVEPEENSGIHAIYASTDVHGDITKNIYRYWRISYVGNGKYTVCPLMNEGRSLSYINSLLKVFNATSPTQWSIHYRNNGYEIVEPESGKGLVLNTGTVETGYYTDPDYYSYYFAAPSV